MVYSEIFDYLIFFKRTKQQAHDYIEQSLPHLIRPEVGISIQIFQSKYITEYTKPVPALMMNQYFEYNPKFPCLLNAITLKPSKLCP